MKSLLMIIGLLSVSFCFSQTFKPNMLIGKWERKTKNDSTIFYFVNNDSLNIKQTVFKPYKITYYPRIYNVYNIKGNVFLFEIGNINPTGFKSYFDTVYCQMKNIDLLEFVHAWYPNTHTKAVFEDYYRLK